MQDKSDVSRLLRIASFLWLAYLGISAIIDYTLKTPGPVEWYFYIADAAIAVFFLIITYIPLLQDRLGRAFLPVIIILICVLPIVFNQVAVRYLFSGPLPLPEALQTRVVPFLLIALILVSWKYKWQHILTFCVALALVDVGILWVLAPGDQVAFYAGLFATLNQTVSFIVVGFFISVMVGWLRKQQCSLEEANSKLTNYAQTLEDLAVTRERSRIAQELHDTLSHTLSGLSVQLETMKAYWDVEPATARKRLDKSLIAIRSGLEETRRVLMALRAKPLEDLGLATAVRQMAQEAATHTGMALDLEVADNLPALSSEAEQCLFRVAQEALTNVVKHAKAKKLTVKLELKDNKVKLAVQDDGIGFDAEDGSNDKHFGLMGMKERVKVTKGDLVINSRPGAGTTVQLTVMP